MKTLIVGTGAVGGFFGGHLARAGNDVTFMARGEHLKAIKENGLTVKSINGDFKIKANAIEWPDETNIFNLIIFAVKRYDLANASDMVKNLVKKNTIILSLLNGIDSEEFLGAKFGIEKIIGGIAFIGSAIESHGVIRHTAAGFITIGELTGVISDRCRIIKSLFDKANITCNISDNIRKDIWAKMVWNVGFNAITAITGAFAYEVTVNKNTRWIIEQSMAETIKVAEKQGIIFPPDMIAVTIAKTEKTKGIQDSTLPSGIKGSIKTSMLQDMERHKQTEIDFINGAIVRIGKEGGVQTHVNETLYNIVKFMEGR